MILHNTHVVSTERQILTNELSPVCLPRSLATLLVRLHCLHTGTPKNVVCFPQYSPKESPDGYSPVLLQLQSIALLGLGKSTIPVHPTR